MKKMLKKWEGGAKKHGGLGNAMGAQAQAWAAPVHRASAKNRWRSPKNMVD